MGRTNKYEQANILLSDQNRPAFEALLRKVLSAPEMAKKSPAARVDAAARAMLPKIKHPILTFTRPGIKEGILSILDSE